MADGGVPRDRGRGPAKTDRVVLGQRVLMILHDGISDVIEVLGRADPKNVEAAAGRQKAMLVKAVLFQYLPVDVRNALEVLMAENQKEADAATETGDKLVLLNRADMSIEQAVKAGILKANDVLAAVMWRGPSEAPSSPPGLPAVLENSGVLGDGKEEMKDVPEFLAAELEKLKGSTEEPEDEPNPLWDLTAEKPMGITKPRGFDLSDEEPPRPEDHE